MRTLNGSWCATDDRVVPVANRQGETVDDTAMSNSREGSQRVAGVPVYQPSPVIPTWIRRIPWKILQRPPLLPSTRMGPE